jgi:hypothetical protein
VPRKKRVLLTVGPGLIEGRRCMTQRSLATALDKVAELFVVSVGSYDFRKDLVHAYRRARGGRFEDCGMIAPAADLWIVYSDGYYFEHRALGFQRQRDFFDAQIAFHQRQIERGNVGIVINDPAVEARTLKSWLASVDTVAHRVIPTHLFASIDEVRDFQCEHGEVVAKLAWGGAGTGACRLSSEADVRAFCDALEKSDGTELSDYCFQPFLRGDEKRMWFAGGRFVAGRSIRGRATPWSPRSPEYDVRPYDAGSEGFCADLEAAQDLCRLSGLNVGAIDFIGDRINEINGCGTLFTEYRGWQCIVDARPALVRYFSELLQSP